MHSVPSLERAVYFTCLTLLKGSLYHISIPLVFSRREEIINHLYMTHFLVPSWCTVLPFRDCLNKIYTLTRKGYEKPEICTGNFIKHSTAPIMKLLIQLQRHDKLAGMFLSCFANTELPTVQLAWQETFTIANKHFTFHVVLLFGNRFLYNGDNYYRYNNGCVFFVLSCLCMYTVTAICKFS